MSAQRWGRRIATGLVAMLSVTLVGGTAYAVWHTSGTGTAAATGLQPAALTATASITGTLRPAGPTRDLAVSVTNPNATAVTVTAITVSGSITATGGTGTCATTGVTVTLPPSISLAVPAGATRTYTATGAVAMSTASASGCQGATFTVPIMATGKLP